MCACDLATCPSCHPENFTQESDWLKKVKKTLLTLEGGFEPVGHPPTFVSIPQKAPSLGEVHAAIKDFQKLNYDKPQKIKLTPEQVAHLKITQTEPPVWDASGSSLLGVPVEIIAPNTKEDMEIKGFEPVEAKIVSAGQSTVDDSGAEPELKKFDKHARAQVRAWAATHEVQLHAAYDMLGLAEHYGDNPYNVSGNVPKTGKDYGWPDFAKAASKACGGPESHACEACKAQYDKKFPVKASSVKVTPLTLSPGEAIVSDSFSAATLKSINAANPAPLSVQGYASGGYVGAPYAPKVELVTTDGAQIDLPAKVVYVQNEFHGAPKVTAELAVSAAALANYFANSKVAALEQEISLLKEELAAKAKPKPETKEGLSLNLGDQVILTATTDASVVSFPSNVVRTVVRK